MPVDEPAPGDPELGPELRSLFHQLNNQLGIILAYAELLETKAAADIDKTRAAQIVRSALDAMCTTKLIRQSGGPSNPSTRHGHVSARASV